MRVYKVGRRCEVTMFGMSGTEIAILLVLALILLGPQKLPEIARGLGKGMRDFRRATDDIRSSVETEFFAMDAPPKIVPAQHVIAKNAPAVTITTEAVAAAAAPPAVATETDSTKPAAPAVAAQPAPPQPVVSLSAADLTEAKVTVKPGGEQS